MPYIFGNHANLTKLLVQEEEEEEEERGGEKEGYIQEYLTSG
jgi:hypothetical protein